MGHELFVTSTPQIVTFDSTAIPIKKSLRRIGYPSSQKNLPHEINKIFEKMLDLARNLIEPQAVYRILKVQSKDALEITFRETLFVIKSLKVAKMLLESKYVVLFMTTIGPRLESKVTSLFNSGEPTSGFILDAIGSETADEVANTLHRIILNNIAADQGFSITPRFSPGYGDWSLAVQKELLEICNGSQIGIAVNEQSLMIPRKSVSAVVGLVPK